MNFSSPTLRERFWANVNKQGTKQPHMRSRCWEWTGAIRHGYGAISVARSVAAQAHRVSWFLEHGTMPTGHICHHCDNRACVRPSHLFDGTCQENMIDMSQKGRSGYKKLTPDDVRKIRNLSSTQGARKSAKQFGVSRTMIRSILSGTSWSWLDANS